MGDRIRRRNNLSKIIEFPSLKSYNAQVTERRAESGFDTKTLEPGQVFRPFDTLGAIRLDSIYQDPIKFSIVFQGIPGRFLLCPYFGTYEARNAWAPFGEIYLSKRFIDGKQVLDEAPMEVLVSFDVSNLEQFKELQKYVLEFSLNGKRFFMRCQGEESEELFSKLLPLSKDGVEITIMRDIQGRQIFLPGRVNLLSQVHARIIEGYQMGS